MRTFLPIATLLAFSSLATAQVDTVITNAQIAGLLPSPNYDIVKFSLTLGDAGTSRSVWSQKKALA